MPLSEFYISENGELKHAIIEQPIALLFSDFEPSFFKIESPFFAMLCLCQRIHNKEIQVPMCFDSFITDSYTTDLGRFIFANRTQLDLGIVFLPNDWDLKTIYNYCTFGFMQFCQKTGCDLNEFVKWKR